MPNRRHRVGLWCVAVGSVAMGAVRCGGELGSFGAHSGGVFTGGVTSPSAGSIAQGGSGQGGGTTSLSACRGLPFSTAAGAVCAGVAKPAAPAPLDL